MPTLFDPIRVGDLDLPNRIFMAPLTRLRGTVNHVPRPELMAEYYRQRASAGLIISEGTPVDPKGVGYPQVPGIWSAEQVEAWKRGSPLWRQSIRQAAVSFRRSGMWVASRIPLIWMVNRQLRPARLLRMAM